MAFKLPSLVLETTLTAGTGALTLAGAVDTEHQTFAAALSNGDTTHYFIRGGGHREIGYGTYSGGILTRTTVLKSSNANAAVNWPSGAKLIGIAPIGASDLDATNLGRLQGALGVSSFVQTVLDDASAAAVLTTLGVSAFVQTILDDANAAAALATLGIVSGTYTPTGTVVTNLDGITTYASPYVRIGSFCIVASPIDVDMTAGAGAAGEFDLSLPIASAFTNDRQATGTVGSHSSGPNVGHVISNATDDRARVQFRGNPTTSFRLGCIWGYQIL